MGVSCETEPGRAMASIEVDLLNLLDFIEEEIGWRNRWYLSSLIRSATRLLEKAICDSSMNLDIECLLARTQWKLERVIGKINQLLDRGKITQELAEILLERVNQAHTDIEMVKNSI